MSTKKTDREWGTITEGRTTYSIDRRTEKDRKTIVVNEVKNCIAN